MEEGRRVAGSGRGGLGKKGWVKGSREGGGAGERDGGMREGERLFEKVWTVNYVSERERALDVRRESEGERDGEAI